MSKVSPMEKRKIGNSFGLLDDPRTAGREFCNFTCGGAMAKSWASNARKREVGRLSRRNSCNRPPSLRFIDLERKRIESSGFFWIFVGFFFGRYSHRRRKREAYCTRRKLGEATP